MEEEKKKSLFKSLGGMCRPHRMWLPSGLKYMQHLTNDPPLMGNTKFGLVLLKIFLLAATSVIGGRFIGQAILGGLHIIRIHTRAQDTGCPSLENRGWWVKDL